MADEYLRGRQLNEHVIASVKTELEKDLAKMIKDKIGKGPDSIEVFVFPKVAVCYLQGFMTKAEELIVQAGYPEKVSEWRNIYINQSRSEIEKIFEVLLERSIGQFFSHYRPEENTACWTIFFN